MHFRFRRLALAMGLAAGLGGFAANVSVDAAHAATDGVIQPKDINQNLFGACLANPQVGWIVGELGRVLRTEDGGKTFTAQQVSGRRPFFDVFCLDEKTAWVSSTHATLFHTSDGGKTWSEHKAPGDRNLLKVVFSTPERGTAVGDFGLIVHTEDGGKTWQEIPIPTDLKLPPAAEEMGVASSDMLLYGLDFVDPDHGWTAGEFGTILVTSDGGKTWKQQMSNLESTLFGLDFSDLQHGTIVGIDGVILSTEDGGNTWTKQPSPFDERSLYEVKINGNNGWIAGGQGTILTTTDGGKTWKQFATPIGFASEWFRDVALLEGKGMIVGASGLIYALDGEKASLLGRSDAGQRVEEES